MQERSSAVTSSTVVPGAKVWMKKIGSQDCWVTIAVQISRWPHVKSSTPEVVAWKGTTIRLTALTIGPSPRVAASKYGRSSNQAQAYLHVSTQGDIKWVRP